jgi:putative redox protein
VAKPPTVVDLTWIGGLTFAVSLPSHDAAERGVGVPAQPDRGAGAPGVILDSAGIAGPSPVQALGFALAGCMTTDVAHILTKGRHGFRELRSQLTADRALEEPHRFVRMTLHVIIEGNVPPDAVERAIALSREKYCSVWHSMRQDIVFTVTHDIRG